MNKRMYDWEIEQFLRERNYYIGGDDLNFIIDKRNHSQIAGISYNPYDNSYDMWNRSGKHYYFRAMPYDEAIKRGLTRNRDDDWER